VNSAESPDGDVSIPRVPLVLGVAGLAPFAAGALMPWLGPSMWPMATAVYAACILSFMGGVQWGALLSRGTLGGASVNTAYVLSVVPALTAWVALLAAGAPKLTFSLLIAGFASVWAIDGWMRARRLTPPWYLRLRHLLTAGVVLCLASLTTRVFLYGA